MSRNFMSRTCVMLGTVNTKLCLQMYFCSELWQAANTCSKVARVLIQARQVSPSMMAHCLRFVVVGRRSLIDLRRKLICDSSMRARVRQLMFLLFRLFPARPSTLFSKSNSCSWPSFLIDSPNLLDDHLTAASWFLCGKPAMFSCLRQRAEYRLFQWALASSKSETVSCWSLTPPGSLSHGQSVGSLNTNQNETSLSLARSLSQ